MAKSAKKRQAEYRAKRKAQGLCAYPGCDRKPRKHALCPDHRWEAKERARDRTDMASLYPDLLDEFKFLRERLRIAESNVVDLELALARAIRRKAGYLPEGIPDSKRLKPGQPVRVSKKESD